MEGSAPVPVDWFGVVVGAAEVLGLAAVVLGPPVVAGAVAGAADDGAADDVVVVAEDTAVEVSGADEVGPGAALLWTLRVGLCDAFTPEVAAAWATAYALLADTMKAAAAEALLAA